MDKVNFDPYRARILWQSEPSLVTNVELIHGYVRFSLHEDCRKETDPKQGNAVIAVYDKNDNILWSWHIWVVNGVEDYTMKGLAADNTTLSPYQVMNMNLGATASSWTDRVKGAYRTDTTAVRMQMGRQRSSCRSTAWCRKLPWPTLCSILLTW